MTVRSVGTLTSSGNRRSMRWYQGATVAWPCCLHPVALMIGCWSVVLSSIDITVKAQSSEYRIPIPYYRFTLWRDLDRATTQARALELAYNERSWNAPGTNAIEEQAYGSIEAESTTRITAVRAIGFDEDTWDCWVNHYGDYEWDELVEEEVDQYFRALGWTQSLWDGGGSAVTDELDWEDLTSAERAAALALCYTSDLWDGLELTQWSVLPTRPSTPQPTPRPTHRPTLTPTPRRTSRPTSRPTLAPTNIPTRRPTHRPTDRPTLTPTVTPTAEPTVPLPPESTRRPTDVPTVSPTSEPTQSVAPTLQPSISPTESPTAIPTSEPTALPTFFPTQSPTTAQPTVAIPMGTMAPTTLAPPIVTLAPMVTAPVTEPPSTSSSRIPPDVAPIRYVVFANLTMEMIRHARALSYTEQTWNLPGSAVVEELSYINLRGQSPAAIETIAAMGMSRDQWDCYINHYEDSSWSLLERNGVQVFYRVLGWTEQLWDSDGAPPSDDKYWRQLSIEEKDAAIELCFRQETWDGIPLTAWSGSRSISMLLSVGMGMLALIACW